MSEREVALVSGAGSGIGRAIAIAIAHRGAHVFLVGRTEAALEETEQLIASSEGSSTALVADLTDATAARAVVRDAINAAGQLDIVVHAAATCAPSSVLELTEEIWDRTVDVALRGTAMCTIEAARHMSERRRGRIIFITSIDAQLVEPGLAHYCAAKAGLEAFGRSMAVELGAAGVSVNSIAPGWVRTDTAAARLDQATPASLERLNALARPAAPEEIASVASYLAFDAPPYLTGTTITVDGAQSVKAAMP